MKIKELYFKDYCGYADATFRFKDDFTCFIGPNGAGKTTILSAVTLLTSSLDFEGQKADAAPGGWTPTVSPQARLKAFLKKNIRNIDTDPNAKTFLVKGVFEHEGKNYEAILNQDGWIKNELLSQPFWSAAGMVYFAKFDVDMVNFQLRADLWPRFKQAYEEVTGFKVEPEMFTETELKKRNLPSEIAVGFWLEKPNGTKIHCRKCSAGERKLAKAFSQVVNIEDGRRPFIVLIDEIEKHVHYKRHLNMIAQCKDIFKGMQLICTTHSLPVMEQYEPKDAIIDIETIDVAFKENV